MWLGREELSRTDVENTRKVFFFHTFFHRFAPNLRHGSCGPGKLPAAPKAYQVPSVLATQRVWP